MGGVCTRKHMTNEQNTMIALPGGEWLKPLQDACAEAGLTWQQDSERNYQVRFPDLKTTGIIVRTKDVPRLVARPNSPAIAGFTGSDILVEAGASQLGNPQNWEVPLKDSAPRASVYLGLTPNAYEQFGSDPTVADIMEGVHRLSVSRTCSPIS